MNQELEELLKRHEGWKLKPYLCPAGHKTIGCGHNIDANPLPKPMSDYLSQHGEITDEMAHELLRQDIMAAEAGCKFLFPDFDNFTPARHNAFVDFVFNVGIGTARKFKKAIAAANAGNWGTAAVEMQDSAWFKQVGNRGKEIVNMIKVG